MDTDDTDSDPGQDTDRPDTDVSDTDVLDTDGADTDVADTDPGDDGALFAAVQEQVFVSCGGGPGLRACHSRSPFQAGLSLTRADGYDNLVNVPATMAPGAVRVVPGDVEDSFLWRKLVNDLPEDGSLGQPMPLGEAIQWRELPPEAIEAVRAWIAAGAPP